MARKQTPADASRKNGRQDAPAALPATPPVPPRITPLSSPLGLEARLADLLESGQPAVLMTVISREGSAPRGAGTRALLTADGLLGTVGGGALEAAALDMARQCLASGLSACHLCRMDGSADTDMICGGSMEVLCESLDAAQAPLFRQAQRALDQGIEGIWSVDVTREKHPRRVLYLERQPDSPATPTDGLSLDLSALPGDTPGVIIGLDPARNLLEKNRGKAGLVDATVARIYMEPLDTPPVLLLCGGGHVSLEVATLAHACGFVVDVVDDRAEFASPDRFPMARHCFVLKAFADLVRACGIGRRHYVAIMTRGHSFDREVLVQALESHAFYIGMIGSRSKRESVYAALRAEGMPDAELACVRCPIGLPVGADSPQQIAVSVVAELLAARAGTLQRLRIDD
ncbi:XdhC/CoxI family protein [uncultured Desulfovibrio sp.]|uniref:XdhC family protein n=1 Tax=Candidatus Desulfovibrio intestinavium TaxID=2838534 RepID=A0A9D2HK91_9BACT|nr:XdhC/CoxI family protein [uncultured Desulfovibrio sp.]HJA78501.1 XdhC family protein [Candidatus Desulfovibrio intestinavium]